MLGLAWLGGREYVRRHPQNVPWTELDLDQPIGAFTMRKLTMLGDEPAEHRALLADAQLPNVHTEATMLDAARRVVELAGEGGDGVHSPTVPVGEGRETDLGAADARREAGSE